MALAIKRPGDIPLGNRPAYYANLAFALAADPTPWETTWLYEGVHLVLTGRAKVPPNIELDVVEYDPADVVRAEFEHGHPGVRRFTMTSFESWTCFRRSPSHRRST